ncbi:hypothetical protein FSP39_002160 [Pinctada imbricata]|uniref:ATP-dependent DNA helicase n=1 Tax=Pinctada imbricata TaxID=66713 RepID=A0AA88YH46_PINIB|nr:hypothetical protein FSP39_002160 [Pinctada imbricata]
MRELPSGSQAGFRGNVVNVPADNISAVETLPRRLDNTDTIPVKLKRRLRYRSHYMFENIRPRKCLEASRYLMSKPLFKDYVRKGIDESWLDNTRQQSTEQITCMDCGDGANCNISQDNNVNQSSETGCSSSSNEDRAAFENQTDDWSESEDEENRESLGEMDTMLHPDIASLDGNTNISVAPSEGNIPISIFTENIEELAYPSIFCGEKRPKNSDRLVPVRYSDICKSELRRTDRRAASSITNIFFKARKLQLKQIQDKVWLSMKRNKTKGKEYTAKDVRNKDTVDKMVKLDEGYRIFRTLRGSPPYWESAKRDIFAMIRQLGLPTWFISLSSAETRWIPILQSLGRRVDKIEYSEEQIESMSWQKKSLLIKSDPVAVASYFDYRVQQFFATFLLNPLNPLGKVKDWFYRIEFQQRGSPHIHGLLWVENAPLYNKNDDIEIQDFVGQYISTEKDSDTLVKYQMHRHSHTCRKGKKRQCRFHFPLPPMKSTKILHPYVPETPEEKKKLEEIYEKVETTIEQFGMQAEVTHELFLEDLNLSDEEYMKVLSLKLSDAKVFLRRSPDAIRVNGYSPAVLRAWQANHDIQFVLDAYACAMYIVSYMSKGQRGLSELLRRTCEEAKEVGSDIKSQVKAIGNKFTKHSEMSAQEAVYIALQLPLRRSSRSFIFINTSPPEERPFILKSEEQLKALPGDSKDIQCANLFSRYIERPRTMENMCLADFAVWFELCRKKKTNCKNVPEPPETDSEDNEDTNPNYTLQDVQGNIVKLRSGTVLRNRKNEKIAKYVRYSKKNNSENFYREQLLLFYPWRCEQSLIGNQQTYEDQYNILKAEIDKKRYEYEHFSEELDLAEKMLECSESTEDLGSSFAPCAEDANARDRDRDDLRENVEDQFADYDIGQDIGLETRCGTDVAEELIRNRVSDEKFRSQVRSLNQKQREFFDHILKLVKTSTEQFFVFLTGGAGVGKSLVTKTLYQALVRHLNTAAGDNPEQLKVMLTAPTCKAAYLIGGNTIHSTFNIPANQSLTYRSLIAEKLNTLRTKLGSLRILFIDEISMCGRNLFSFIDNRLQEIMQKNIPFGGVSLICIGDLFQLHPVMDRWIFQPSASVDDLSVLAPNVWVDNVHMFELTQIMRQAGDRVFAEALNNIREGKQTKEDLDLISTRLVQEKDRDNLIDIPHILYYNKAVQAHNTQAFLRTTGEKVSSYSVDIVIGDLQPAVKERILQAAPQRAGDSMGLSKVFQTGVGLRVELTLNLDVGDGLVNGAGGVTKLVTCDSQGDPSVVWILFDDEIIGKERRRSLQHLYHSGVDALFTPITFVSRQFPVGKYKNAKLQRSQFPLQLSAGKTVHRSQGDTLSEIVVQLPNERRPHIHYVALSRVTSLSGLHILQPFDPSKITVSEDVHIEMLRLRESRSLQLCYLPLYNIPKEAMKICFLNVQSYKLHAEDVKADRNLTSTNVLVMVESKLCANDTNVQMEGFKCYRHDYRDSRSAYGSVVFVKEPSFVNSSSTNVSKAAFEIVLTKLQTPLTVEIMSVYCKPKETTRNIIEALGHILPLSPMAVIMGDFNCDDRKYKHLVDFFRGHGFTQVISEPTTINNTCIDLIFTNISLHRISAGTLETYYSYHKAVWISIQ